MRQPRLRLVLALCLAATPLAAVAASDTVAGTEAIEAAVSAPTRTPANVARDAYRHPAETLTFFGVEPDDTLVELWPGNGWYTEILAPMMGSGGGTYYAVAPDGGLNGVRRMMEANPGLYGKVRTAAFTPGAATPPIPAGTADVVLTFRNVHNWMSGDSPFAANAFSQFYGMLKPGGVLGVVEHRLPEAVEGETRGGYVKTSAVRRLAEEAGFRFVGASEINANPKDSADWPGGVWTLPPALRGDEAQRDKYLEIGESDRMTLKFVKPE